MSPRSSSRHRAAARQRMPLVCSCGQSHMCWRGTGWPSWRASASYVSKAFHGSSWAVAGPEARWRHHRWWQRLAMIAALAADIGRCKLGPADSKLASSAAAAVEVAVETSAVGQGETLSIGGSRLTTKVCVEASCCATTVVPYRSSDAHSTKSTHSLSFLRTNLLGVICIALHAVCL